MKLPFYFTGIALLVVVVAPTTAAETETERLKQAQGLFHPLPRDMAMPDAPITPERVGLGRLLFFDPRLTVDPDVSCSSCHQPARYGTDGRTLVTPSPFDRYLAGDELFSARIGVTGRDLAH